MESRSQQRETRSRMVSEGQETEVAGRERAGGEGLGLGGGLPGGLLRQARRLIVLVVGGTVLLLGVAMMVLPGPAVVVIPAGIAILATEFAWARRLLRAVRERIGLGEGDRQGGNPPGQRASDAVERPRGQGAAMRDGEPSS
jgi:hypothetical protein